MLKCNNREVIKMAKLERDASSYCYEEVLKLICIGHTEAFRKGTASSTIFNNWTPNNVRRLIIGVQGVIVQYYTAKGMSNKALTECKLFSPQMAKECFESPDYKPMITALVGERRCTGIEEIVICLPTANSPIQLPVEESNFNLLLNEKALSGKVDVAQLRRKFPRLACISCITPLGVSQKLCNIAKSMGSLFTREIEAHKDELPGIRVDKIIVNPDYDTALPNMKTANFYEPERQGGSLNMFFKGYLEKKENDKKKALEAAKLAEYNKKYDTSVKASSKFDKAVELANISVSGLDMFIRMADSKNLSRVVAKHIHCFDDLGSNRDELVHRYFSSNSLVSGLYSKLNKLYSKDTVKTFIEGKNINKCALRYFESLENESSAEGVNVKETLEKDITEFLIQFSLMIVNIVMEKACEGITTIKVETPSYFEATAKKCQGAKLYLYQDLSISEEALQGVFISEYVENLNKNVIVNNYARVYWFLSKLLFKNTCSMMNYTMEDWENKF